MSIVRVGFTGWEIYSLPDPNSELTIAWRREVSDDPVPNLTVTTRVDTVPGSSGWHEGLMSAHGSNR